MFGMVLQDTWLFNGTIRENIAYGREDATEEEIVQAAQGGAGRSLHPHAAGELRHACSTRRRRNLSQGQKQLLTIARAFLADPAILILDEATSSVDTRTEVLIQQAMSELMRGRTSFVIAHRLSTIRNADLILVMDHGSIVEQGTHEELLAQGRLLRRPLQQPVRGPPHRGGGGALIGARPSGLPQAQLSPSRPSPTCMRQAEGVVCARRRRPHTLLGDSTTPVAYNGCWLSIRVAFALVRSPEV